jgi:hypothetical protein
MIYGLEKDLVEDFIQYLPTSPFAEHAPFSISKEFDYNRGRTDIILLSANREIIAFEAKLEKWRYALDQAYRNTCFSNYSYVLLTEKTAKIAMVHIVEFTLRKVGVCYLSEGEIVVIHDALRTEPLQNCLFNRAQQTILEGIQNAKFCNAF